MPQFVFFASVVLFLTQNSLGFLEAMQAQEQVRKRKPNPAMAKIKDKPGLPRVLLIGDSISIGYTVPVREMLEGKANVHRALTNCGPTIKGVKELDSWLGDEPWDVIPVS